jgi:hypothetical protein
VSQQSFHPLKEVAPISSLLSAEREEQVSSRRPIVLLPLRSTILQEEGLGWLLLPLEVQPLVPLLDLRLVDLIWRVR